MTELRELGLSSYEEKAYRMLLVTGAVTATELSTASGVPKGRIYDVLNGLEARKLIRTQSNDPTQYAAVEPETVIDRLLAERTYELTQQWSRYREVAEAVRSSLLPTPPAESSFWFGSVGSDDMSTVYRQHLQTAEEYVHASVGSPYENATWETLQREFEALIDGASTDIRVALLVSEAMLDVLPNTFPQQIAERSVDIDIRTTPDISLSFDVVDHAVTTIDILHPVAANDRLCVVRVKETDIVTEFERQFQRLWMKADSIVE